VHDTSIAEAGIEAAVRPVASEREAERVPAVRLSRDHDPAVRLHGDGTRELEAPEVGFDPAALPEGRIELAVGQVAEGAEVPARGPVDQLADRDDPPVALDGHVFGASGEVVVRGRADLEGAKPAVAREGAIEVARSGRRGRGEGGAADQSPDGGRAHHRPSELPLPKAPQTGDP
jgi:hypothetical protein